LQKQRSFPKIITVQRKPVRMCVAVIFVICYSY
jgi:hypothetical protein